MSRTALIMAGGTGGHVFPALAVADALAARGWQVVWLGTKAGIESRLVPERGYAIEYVRMGGLRGKGILRVLAAPFMVALACAQSLAVLLRHRPDVVVGFGGFAALPGGLTASLLRRPLIIHEQNSVAGMTNRVLALFAQRVFAGFPDPFAPRGSSLRLSALWRPRNVEWVGNPVRDTICQLPPPEERYAGRTGVLRILVIGGSQGAKALNALIPEALSLIPLERRPQVVHQGGPRMLDALVQSYRLHGITADLRPFIDDMAQAYRECDLVICRSGALTVAELAAAGVASILVPFPAAVDDHQTVNARFMQSHGAARLIPQSQLQASGLAGLLQELTREALLGMAQAARSLAKPDATRTVAQACVEVAA
jgi:UDP-N-acetylglucosamine--N-acetylmuramyl-(pentapeptide) pyrophosphoryl-undecaprenol N-acetylglucosamine transferase